MKNRLNNATYSQFTVRRPTGFTLVELLVTISIIGILMAIAIPAIGRALRSAKIASLRTEIEALSQSIEAYKLKYGDYPPDFMDWNVVVRHYRKIRPDIDVTELTTLQALTYTSGVFDPTRVDRAEAIVWALGGFSSDPKFPFTGQGGPLTFFGNRTVAAELSNPLYYSYNSTRENALFDIDTQDLNIAPIDETTPFPSTTNRRLSLDEPVVGNRDVFPIYKPDASAAPFIYFDSRTYAGFIDVGGYPQFNGFAQMIDGVIDGVRPMLSKLAVPENIPATTGTISERMQRVLGGFQFMNPNTFQVFCAGLDGRYGAVVTVPGSSSPDIPVYFQYPTGKAIGPTATTTTVAGLYVVGASKFQDTSFTGVTILENYVLDNLSSFSSRTFEDDIEE